VDTLFLLKKELEKLQPVLRTLTMDIGKPV